PIPCGGPVRPLGVPRALLAGDAAGIVSPLTAGGIHTALRYGVAAGHAIADFLDGRSGDPAEHVARLYPPFQAKRLLRAAFDHLRSDGLFNALLSTPPMRYAARKIYFHR
ncbi:MAG: NAD(P)/FAD-dependent oxidoreductase, partial [Xanthomonadales bacterium]|nr:NAD(P)/FAD-dependent oxidoreductase [Xanthomonadales bacterium]